MASKTIKINESLTVNKAPAKSVRGDEAVVTTKSGKVLRVTIE